MADLAWRTDLLGPGWQQLVLEVGTDEHGPVVATLVRRTPAEPSAGPGPAAPSARPGPAAPSARPGPAAPSARPGPAEAPTAVLHVHGFNDYFFQTHLADAFEAEGYVFYAVDLRRCGRSLRPGQVPHYCTDLTEYAADLTAAARVIRQDLGHDRLVVHAHSTGGLTASLWTHSLRRAGVVDALVLDSPWFDLDARWFHRVVSTRVLEVAPVDPLRIVADGPSAYSHHLHVDHGGRWTYDLALKPPEGFPVRAGWIRAVRRGQARLARGLDIACPVLVATSTTSGPNRLDNPDLDRQDTVLDVERIAARAPRLGGDVTLVRIAGGVHDLALSAPGPRAEYLSTVLGWLSDRLAPRAAPAPSPARSS